MIPTSDHLSSLDAFFLAAERENTPMHIGATLLFEAGPLARPGRRVDVAALRRHVSSRLHRIPRYRQRLASTPLERRPIWVDDEKFRLDSHVRHLRLRRATGERALHEAAGEILSRPLDRGRPLWELWILDGFAKNRFAVITKVHHCMADGIGGVEQLCALLDPLAGTEAETPVPWAPRPAPGTVALLGEELTTGFRNAVSAARWVGDALRSPVSAWNGARETATALSETVDAAMAPSRSTPFNGPISADRRFQWIGMSLSDVRRVKQKFGGTLNDVVLATVAGALRRTLAGHGGPSGSGELRVAVPVAMNGQESSGNRVSLWLLPMPVDEPDATKRFAGVHAATAEKRTSGSARTLYSLVRLGDALSPTILDAGVRILDQLLPFNLIVTNVPGPQFPLWMNGARLLSAYPAVPLFENQGLGIALFSYDGALYWGFLADPSRVPDLGGLVYATAASFCELLEHATADDPATRDTEMPAALSATA